MKLDQFRILTILSCFSSRTFPMAENKISKLLEGPKVGKSRGQCNELGIDHKLKKINNQKWKQLCTVYLFGKSIQINIIIISIKRFQLHCLRQKGSSVTDERLFLQSTGEIASTLFRWIRSRNLKECNQY